MLCLLCSLPCTGVLVQSRTHRDAPCMFVGGRNEQKSSGGSGVGPLLTADMQISLNIKIVDHLPSHMLSALPPTSNIYTLGIFLNPNMDTPTSPQTCLIIRRPGPSFPNGSPSPCPSAPLCPSAWFLKLQEFVLNRAAPCCIPEKWVCGVWGTEKPRDNM